MRKGGLQDKNFDLAHISNSINEHQLSCMVAYTPDASGQVNSTVSSHATGLARRSPRNRSHYQTSLSRIRNRTSSSDEVRSRDRLAKIGRMFTDSTSGMLSTVVRMLYSGRVHSHCYKCGQLERPCLIRQLVREVGSQPRSTVKCHACSCVRKYKFITSDQPLNTTLRLCVCNLWRDRY